MNKRDLLNDYYAWLLSIIGADMPPYNDFTLLIQALYSREFVWNAFDAALSKDEGRALDGLGLRNQFLDIYFGGNYYYLTMFDNKPCSLLEMLIALASRATYEARGFEDNNSITFWFWKMIDNLKLLEFTDECYEGWKVQSILDAFLNRAYTSRGDGSIFPIQNRNVDCRKLELFYQLQRYLNENYIFSI